MIKLDRHYFIAIPVPLLELKQLSEAVNLGHYYQQVYGQEDFHLTLHFLGGLTERELNEWQCRLKEIAATVQPFTLIINHLVTFGNEDRPRVFAAGVEETTSLLRLANQLAPERHKPFVPHITLAKRWNVDCEEPLPDMTLQAKINVTELILYEIHPADRPRYRINTLARCGKEQ